MFSDSLFINAAVFVTCFLLAVCFSMLINYLFLKFVSNLGMRDLQNEGMVRWASQSKPSLGGFSFYMLFLLSVSMVGMLPDVQGEFLNKELIGMMAGCSLAFLIGLADDAYNTNPLVKFIGQFTCANILITTGYLIPATPVPEFNYVFTMLWIIGLMNSINMLDNMDAISTLASIAVVGGVLMIIVLNADFHNVYVIIMLGLLGALLGFLYFNWHPSRMYMGDTGSQFLGMFLAAISILYLWNFRDPEGAFVQPKQFLIPLLLFIVPLIDTTTVFIRRLARKQSPFVGGRDHITHHLAYLGLSDRMVAIVLGSVSLLSIVLVYFYHQNFDDLHNWFIFLGFAYFVLLFGIIQILYNRGKHLQSKVSG